VMNLIADSKAAARCDVDEIIDTAGHAVKTADRGCVKGHQVFQPARKRVFSGPAAIASVEIRKITEVVATDFPSALRSGRRASRKLKI